MQNNIRELVQRSLLAQLIYKVAHVKKHPLHSCFQWKERSEQAIYIAWQSTEFALSWKSGSVYSIENVKPKWNPWERVPGNGIFVLKNPKDDNDTRLGICRNISTFVHEVWFVEVNHGEGACPVDLWQ
jgi:hypothetical protein